MGNQLGTLMTTCFEQPKLSQIKLPFNTKLVTQYQQLNKGNFSRSYLTFIQSQLQGSSNSIDEQQQPKFVLKLLRSILNQNGQELISLTPFLMVLEYYNQKLLNCKMSLPYVSIYHQPGEFVFLLRQYVYKTLEEAHTTDKVYASYQMIKAIQELHLHGLVHGDVKLSNFVVTQQDEILLTDFAPFKPGQLDERDDIYMSFFFNTTKSPCRVIKDSTRQSKDFSSNRDVQFNSTVSNDSGFQFYMCKQSTDVFELSLALLDLWNGKQCFNKVEIELLCSGEYKDLENCLKHVENDSLKLFIKECLTQQISDITKIKLDEVFQYKYLQSISRLRFLFNGNVDNNVLVVKELSQQLLKKCQFSCYVCAHQQSLELYKVVDRVYFFDNRQQMNQCDHIFTDLLPNNIAPQKFVYVTDKELQDSLIILLKFLTSFLSNQTVLKTTQTLIAKEICNIYSVLDDSYQNQALTVLFPLLDQTFRLSGNIDEILVKLFTCISNLTTLVQDKQYFIIFIIFCKLFLSKTYVKKISELVQNKLQVVETVLCQLIDQNFDQTFLNVSLLTFAKAFPAFLLNLCRINPCQNLLPLLEELLIYNRNSILSAILQPQQEDENTYIIQSQLFCRVEQLYCYLPTLVSRLIVILNSRLPEAQNYVLRYGGNHKQIKKGWEQILDSLSTLDINKNDLLITYLNENQLTLKQYVNLVKIVGSALISSCFTDQCSLRYVQHQLLVVVCYNCCKVFPDSYLQINRIISSMIGDESLNYIIQLFTLISPSLKSQKDINVFVQASSGDDQRKNLLLIKEIDACAVSCDITLNFEQYINTGVRKLVSFKSFLVDEYLQFSFMLNQFLLFHEWLRDFRKQLLIIFVQYNRLDKFTLMKQSIDDLANCKNDSIIKINFSSKQIISQTLQELSPDSINQVTQSISALSNKLQMKHLIQYLSKTQQISLKCFSTLDFITRIFYPLNSQSKELATYVYEHLVPAGFQIQYLDEIINNEIKFGENNFSNSSLKQVWQSFYQMSQKKKLSTSIGQIDYYNFEQLRETINVSEKIVYSNDMLLYCEHVIKHIFDQTNELQQQFKSLREVKKRMSYDEQQTQEYQILNQQALAQLVQNITKNCLDYALNNSSCEPLTVQTDFIGALQNSIQISLQHQEQVKFVCQYEDFLITVDTSNEILINYDPRNKLGNEFAELVGRLRFVYNSRVQGHDVINHLFCQLLNNKNVKLRQQDFKDLLLVMWPAKFVEYSYSQLILQGLLSKPLCRVNLNLEINQIQFDTRTNNLILTANEGIFQLKVNYDQLLIRAIEAYSDKQTNQDTFSFSLPDEIMRYNFNLSPSYIDQQKKHDINRKDVEGQHIDADAFINRYQFSNQNAHPVMNIEAFYDTGSPFFIPAKFNFRHYFHTKNFFQSRISRHQNELGQRGTGLVLSNVFSYEGGTKITQSQKTFLYINNTFVTFSQYQVFFHSQLGLILGHHVFKQQITSVQYYANRFYILLDKQQFVMMKTSDKIEITQLFESDSEVQQFEVLEIPFLVQYHNNHHQSKLIDTVPLLALVSTTKITFVHHQPNSQQTEIVLQVSFKQEQDFEIVRPTSLYLTSKIICTGWSNGQINIFKRSLEQQKVEIQCISLPQRALAFNLSRVLHGEEQTSIASQPGFGINGQPHCLFDVDGDNIEIRMYVWDFASKEMQSGYTAETELHSIRKNFHSQPIIYLKYEDLKVIRYEQTTTASKKKEIICPRLTSVDITGKYILWK